METRVQHVRNPGLCLCSLDTPNSEPSLPKSEKPLSKARSYYILTPRHLNSMDPKPQTLNRIGLWGPHYAINILRNPSPPKKCVGNGFRPLLLNPYRNPRRLQNPKTLCSQAAMLTRRPKVPAKCRRGGGDTSKARFSNPQYQSLNPRRHAWV